MYLSRIELFGFKSFAQKTVVDFSSGVTCVVGPNGCGKTNILDAVRWVLGEQKSSTLRSDRMESVIFNGSRHRKPLGMSEVSLTIQNSRNILPVEYSEILITRRLYRSGESEYLMNRAPCRLKDITDLFMDTGMGPGSYSVIELKMVENLLSDKPEERRLLFEEAAGITKYKHRRRAALRKLEETRSHIERLEDILAEAERQANGLQRQVRKTQRYRELQTELKLLDTASARAEYNTLLCRCDPMQAELDSGGGIVKDLDRQLLENETQSTALNRDQLLAEEELHQAEDEQTRLRAEVRRLEESLLVGRERSSALTRDVDRLASERDTLSTRIEESSQTLSEVEGRLTDAQDHGSELDADLEKARSRASEAEALQQSLRGKMENSRKRVLELISRYAQRNTDLARITSSLEQVQQRVRDLEEERQLASQDRSMRAEQRKSLEEEYKRGAATLDERDQTLAEAGARQQAARDELDHARHSETEGTGELKALQGRREFLDGMLQRFEGVPGGARAVLEAGITGISDTFGNLVHCERELIPALEAAVGQAAGWLVAEDRNAVSRAAELLKREDRGDCTFVMLDQVPTSVSATAPAGCSSILEHVKVADRYRPLAAFLLNDCWYSENPEAVDLDALPAHALVMGPDGRWLRPPAVIHVARRDGQQDSHLGLRFQLEGLESDVRRQQLKLEELRATRVASEQKLQMAGDTRRQAEEDLKTAEAALRGIQARLDQLDYAEERQLRDEEHQSKTLASLQERVSREQKQEGLLKSELEELQLERDDAEGEVASLQRNLDRREQEFRDAAEQRTRAELAAREHHLRLEAEQREQQRLFRFISEGRQRLDEMAHERREAQESLESLKERLEREDRDLHLAEEARGRQQSVLDQCKDRVQQLHTAMKELARTAAHLRAERQDIGERRHRTELELSEMRIKITGLQERVRAEYELELEREEDAAELQQLLDLNLEESRKRIVELREALRRLGPVNLLAIEEYDEVRERRDFLRNQIRDLLEAEAMLKETIQRINRVARELFEATFEKIRTNFEYLFRKLFNDGRADLRLSAEDPLEADIAISATPSGKRIQSLTLMSGGEKTLTAIALLFAIYMVKPSPFCILDEVDAPLDDANIGRFNNLIREFSGMTQFIIITHNKKTMGYANQLYGVTMAEEGVSTLVSVQFHGQQEVSA